jgi:hypothetical protein
VLLLILGKGAKGFFVRAPALFPTPHILKRMQARGLPDNNVPNLELGNEEKILRDSDDDRNMA